MKLFLALTVEAFAKNDWLEHDLKEYLYDPWLKDTAPIGYGTKTFSVDQYLFLNPEFKKPKEWGLYVSAGGAPWTQSQWEDHFQNYDFEKPVGWGVPIWSVEWFDFSNEPYTKPLYDPYDSSQFWEFIDWDDIRESSQHSPLLQPTITASLKYMFRAIYDSSYHYRTHIITDIATVSKQDLRAIFSIVTLELLMVSQQYSEIFKQNFQSAAKNLDNGPWGYGYENHTIESSMSDYGRGKSNLRFDAYGSTAVNDLFDPSDILLTGSPPIDVTIQDVTDLADQYDASGNAQVVLTVVTDSWHPDYVVPCGENTTMVTAGDLPMTIPGALFFPGQDSIAGKFPLSFPHSFGPTSGLFPLRFPHQFGGTYDCYSDLDVWFYVPESSSEDPVSPAPIITSYPSGYTPNSSSTDADCHDTLTYNYNNSEIYVQDNATFEPIPTL